MGRFGGFFQFFIVITTSLFKPILVNTLLSILYSYYNLTHILEYLKIPKSFQFFIVITLKAKEALGDLVKVLGEVIVLVEPYALRYKDYSLEKTWVLNKIKKRYYYYYLKSAKRRPHSIYLGSMPVDYPLCKNLAEYVRKIEKTMKMLQKTDIELRYVEAAINITRRLQALEKPIAKIKAKQIPTITEGDYDG